MADIFSDLANFAGDTIRQAITPDNVRDYTHASRLFVGDQYRLVPKNGFLFHLFIDLDSSYYDPQNPNAPREIGLMVKSADLPKFTVETKTFNAYNRPNIVQNKLRYDPINIAFHDDSSNLIRNFWTSYLKYYYRDSDYQLSSYSLPHKYSPQQLPSFGYSPQQSTPFLKSIRLYSLHQKRFSEYILINPIIKSFRHAAHAQDKADTMQHEMTIEYESVLYNSGRTTIGNPPGFAELHYDLTPSPITSAGGGTRSIFGPGGLIDTGRDVLEDISNGNFGSALFKAARGINNAKGMNLKKTAIAEVTNQFNRSIRESVNSQRIIVPNFLGTSGIVNTPYNGIGVGTAVAALAGVAAIRQIQTPEPVNSLRINDIRQSTSSQYTTQLSPYNNSFPPNAGITNTASATPSLQLINEQNSFDATGNQGAINAFTKKQDLTNKIDATSRLITQTSIDLGQAKNQEANATTALSLLALKYNAAIALPDSNINKESLVSTTQQSITQQKQIKEDATNLVDTKVSELDYLNRQLQAMRAEKDAIR